MTNKDREDKLKSIMAGVVNTAKESTIKIFWEGKQFGFDEGIGVAQDYINTIIFQEEAEYPLTKHDLISIFGSDDALDILTKNDIKTIMVSIKEYAKNGSDKETENNE
jgi:hypothetical protein